MEKANNLMSVSDQNILKFPDITGVDDTQAQAIDWAELLQSGRATEDDRHKFEAWLAADIKNAQAYKMLEQWWRDIDYVAASDPELENDIDQYADHAIAGQKTSQSTSLWYRSRIVLGGIAAVLLVAVFVWQATYIAPDGNIPETRYETAMGEIETIELPDGTKIELAGSTTLSVYYSEKERRAELIEGQTYFDVAKDKSRPFIVLVGKTHVRVVGTEFDIQKGGEDVRVSVVEGLVEVAENQSITPAKRLKAGEQVFASLRGDLGEVQTFQPETDIAWKLGRLEYINAPLVRVIDEVNRYRVDKIILNDQSLSDYPITISLAFEQTDRLLTGLEHAGVANISRRYGRVLIDAKEPVQAPISK